MEGWIKIHRKILDWEWYRNNNVRSLFLHILLKANHKDKHWQGISIPQGSFITSLDTLHKETGLTTMQVRVALNKLKITNEITSNSTSQFTHIFITNWHEYQEDNKPDNKPITNQQQTNNKPITTTKNDKNVKNEKNEKKIIQPKTLNLKEIENSNPPYTPPLAEMLDETIKHFNDRLGKRYKSTKSLLGNFEKWTEVYSLDEIKSAIDVLPRHHFWKDKMTPTILFRTMGRDKNPVDYIGDLLNYSPTSTTIEPKDNLKNWI